MEVVMSIRFRFSLLCAAVLLAAPAAFAQTRATAPTGEETGRDAYGFRVDKVTKESVGEKADRERARTPTVQQAIEDFREIQRLNLEISTVIKSAPTAFDKIAEAAKDINTRAGRLKVSLVLPMPAKGEDKKEPSVATTADEFMSLVGRLDLSIKAFVKNPKFRGIKQAGKDEAAEAKEAGASLYQVIELSRVVRQSADTLSRLTNQKQ
jgi:hypothetical protein